MCTWENGFHHKWENSLTAFISNLGVCMCVHTHVWTYVHMCMSAHAKPPFLFLSCLLLYNPSLKQKFSISARVPDPGATKSCQSLLSNSRAVDMFCYYVFIWVLGIWTQVFILAQVLLLISSCQPVLLICDHFQKSSLKVLTYWQSFHQFFVSLFPFFFKWQYIPPIASQTEIEYVVSFAKYTCLFLIHHNWACPEK